jgi:hypothetical protein
VKLLREKECAYEDCTNWIPLFPNGFHNFSAIKESLNFDIYQYDKKKGQNYCVGGCYLYAYSTKNLSQKSVMYNQKEIVYIGEAGSSPYRGILNRTMDFVATLKHGFKQKQPSEHAIHFLAKFGKSNLKNLYVCYIPIGFGEITKTDSLFFEDLLLEDYAFTHGDYPILNRRIEFVDKMVLMYNSLTEEGKRKFKQQIKIAA